MTRVELLALVAAIVDAGDSAQMGTGDGVSLFDGLEAVALRASRILEECDKLMPAGPASPPEIITHGDKEGYGPSCGRCGMPYDRVSSGASEFRSTGSPNLLEFHYRPRCQCWRDGRF